MPTPNLQAGDDWAGVVELLDAIKQLLSSRNPRQGGAGVIVLRLHPRHDFWVAGVLQPAIGVSHVGPEILLRDCADRSFGQLHLRKRDSGQKNGGSQNSEGS